jgi:exodeoxyribonuclease V beta subunit
MPSFDVLDPLHEVMQPHFLEASAGTGKTFSIEHIVARLFLEPKAGLDPPNILIVTFTRASTRDLRLRIRENITAILQILKEKKQTPYRYLTPFLEDEKLRTFGIKRLENILATYDEMEIHTIHGFCSKMLSEYPFEAKTGFSSDYSNHGSKSALHKEVILDVFRVVIDEQGFHPAQIDKLLAVYNYDLHKIATQLSKLIQQEILIEPPKTFIELSLDFEHLVQEMASYYAHCSFEEEFRKVAPHFKGLASIKKTLHPKFLSQINIFEQLFTQKITPKDCLGRLLDEQECFFEKLTEECFKKNAKKEFSCLDAETKILTFSRSLTALVSKALHSSKILLHVAFLCKQALDKSACDKGIVSPDYFLMMMQKKLEEPAFLEKVKSRYKAALIDEFQDTDPLQFSIFEKLFIEKQDNFPLYLVGDPKQSIYAFRNADLQTYLRAKQLFKIEQRFTLDTNYRSEPQLIEALNTLFSLSSKWLCDEGSLLYDKVHYSPFAKNTSWLDGKKALHFFMAESEISRSFSLALKEAEEKVFFPFMAHEINSLIEQGFFYEDIAILVRDRFQGDRVERFLKLQNIPYVATAKVSLQESRSFSFFKILLQILGKKDLGLIKQLFAHPLMGFSDEELKIQELHPSFIFGLEVLKKLISTYESEGFLTFWQLFLQTRFKPLENIFEKDLLSRGYTQEYLDLIQLADLLIEKHQKEFISHQELLGLFLEIENADPEEDPQVCRKTQCDSSAVIIMTIHKSKGLEFKCVFALGTCVRGKDRIEIIKSKRQHETLLQVFQAENPEHQKVVYQDNLEKMRHLYVSFTRAKQRLYIPYLFFDDDKKRSLSALELFFRKSFSEEGLFSKSLCVQKLDALAQESISYSFPCQNNMFLHKSGLVDQNIDIKKPLKFPKNFKEVFVESFSSVTTKDFVKDHSKMMKLSEDQMPSSAEVGEIFHKILEKIFERGLYLHKTFEAISALVSQEIAYSCLKCFELKVLELIHKVLTCHFLIDKEMFCFKDIPYSFVTTEMEFFLEDQEKLFTGSIDLFFKWKEKYFLADWKTNYLGDNCKDYERSCLEKCMKEHSYDIQASLYIKAAKAFLEKKGHKQEVFGGMIYVFLRGLDEEGRGVLIWQ